MIEQQKNSLFQLFFFYPTKYKTNLATKDLTGKRINVTNIEKLALKLVSCFLNLISENNITAVKHRHIIFYRNLISEKQYDGCQTQIYNILEICS